MSSRTASRFFEDFEVGQVIPHRVGRTIGSGERSLYIALTGDRYPIHCDDVCARSLGYSSSPLHDLLIFHVVFGMTVEDISLNAVANIGYADVRFLEPVYEGDTLGAKSVVRGLKENSSGKNGTVYVETRATNQDGVRVLSFNRWVMVHKRDTTTSSGVDERPTLPATVDVASILHPDFTDDLQWVTDAFLEDYSVGEWLSDGAGMTLEESEHAMATRLYQNTAKVHFDSRMMKDTSHGKRLVYGGHVISLAHSLLYTLIPNVVRIAGWNAGTHTNPTFAGDTLYVTARILETEDIDGRSDLGRARVQLLCIKNASPAELDLKFLDDDASGRPKYPPEVVLDLDYWLILPTRGAEA
ncbi:MAG: MaoC family dehydratase [Candidatus Hydrogenedentota bacterium]